VDRPRPGRGTAEATIRTSAGLTSSTVNEDRGIAIGRVVRVFTVDVDAKIPAAVAALISGGCAVGFPISIRPNARRALELLAGSPHGLNEALLIYAHGLSRRTLAGLVWAGLATMRREVAVAGDRPVEVVRIRITAAGRRAIEGMKAICADLRYIVQSVSHVTAQRAKAAPPNFGWLPNTTPA
jgi:hypothetical protein